MNKVSLVRSHIDRRAFTLVELLVVIAIVGLLSSVAVVATKQAGVTARNQKRKANLIQISKALELYYADNGSYPDTGGQWYGQANIGGPRPDTGAGAWIPNLAPAYMATLPRDPLSGKPNPNNLFTGFCDIGNNAGYIYRSNTIDYKVSADCLPEGLVSTSDQFYDAYATNQSQTFSLYTPGAKTWW